MTSLATAIIVFVAFLVGAALGRFERDDRRITHEAPRTVQPSLVKQWRNDRLVREVGNRKR